MARRRKEEPGCIGCFAQFIAWALCLSIPIAIISAVADWLHVSFVGAIVIILLSPIVLYLAFLLLRAVISSIIRKIRTNRIAKTDAPITFQTEPKSGTNSAPAPVDAPQSSTHSQPTSVNIPLRETDRKESIVEPSDASQTRTKLTHTAPKQNSYAKTHTYRPMNHQRGGLGHCLDQYVQDCTVLALTATGYGSDTGEIIELAAIRLRNLETVDTFQNLIKPKTKLTPEWISDTGITNLMLSKAPSIDHVLPAFADFIGNDVIVGFDTASSMYFLYDVFLDHTDHVLGNDYLDLRKLACKTLPDIEPNTISDISIRLGCPHVQSTRTMGRCETIASCYQFMAKMSPKTLEAHEQREPDSKGTALDELLIPAIDWIIQTKMASTSALRREFGIGYSRAQSLMLQIEMLGVVGPPQGNKPREVLMGINPLKD